MIFLHSQLLGMVIKGNKLYPPLITGLFFGQQNQKIIPILHVNPESFIPLVVYFSFNIRIYLFSKLRDFEIQGFFFPPVNLFLYLSLDFFGSTSPGLYQTHMHSLLNRIQTDYFMLGKKRQAQYITYTKCPSYQIFQESELSSRTLYEQTLLQCYQ